MHSASWGLRFVDHLEETIISCLFMEERVLHDGLD